MRTMFIELPSWQIARVISVHAMRVVNVRNSV